MIIFRVKDSETDDDDEGLELPEWMDINLPESDSDAIEASTAQRSTISSDDEISCDDDSSEENDDQDEREQDDDDQNAVNDLINEMPSLSDNMDEESNGFDLFPAYHLPNSMDIPDDEETAAARECWYWYLYLKDYVMPPSLFNQDTNLEANVSEMESTSSGIDEKSKVTDDSIQVCDSLSNDKSEVTRTDEKSEKLTSVDA